MNSCLYKPKVSNVYILSIRLTETPLQKLDLGGEADEPYSDVCSGVSCFILGPYKI